MRTEKKEMIRKFPSPDPLGKPTKWGGGVIYTSASKKAWRVLETVGDRVDKAFPWGPTKKSKLVAFEDACKMILKGRSTEAAS